MMNIAVPVIGYKQGDRQMLVTALDMPTLVKQTSKVEVWNPLGTNAHGNRKQDKSHRQGIADYLILEPNFILGAFVMYVSPRQAKFVPDVGYEDQYIAPGMMHLSMGADLDQGDGQHRLGAESDVLSVHNESGDPVFERLLRSGQPVIFVLDDDPLRRAQDYADLQKNVKPPTSSLGQSMDRRAPINRFMIAVIQDPGLPVFGDLDGGNVGDGRRVEFLADSPGKLSAKLFSYKVVRYTTGTALMGVSSRTSVGWERDANTTVGAEASPEWTLAHANMVDFWAGYAGIPAIAAALATIAADDKVASATTAKLRESSYLLSAGVLYAIASAAYSAYEQGISYADSMVALAGVDYDRPNTGARNLQKSPITTTETIFAGTLIEPKTGKISAGRGAWEAAGADLLGVIVAAQASAPVRRVRKAPLPPKAVKATKATRKSA